MFRRSDSDRSGSRFAALLGLFLALGLVASFTAGPATATAPKRDRRGDLIALLLLVVGVALVLWSRHELGQMAAGEGLRALATKANVNVARADYLHNMSVVGFTLVGSGIVVAVLSSLYQAVRGRAR